MSHTLRLSLALLLASCASDTGGPDEGGSATTTLAELPLFELAREGVPPAATVHLSKDGYWGLTSKDACRGVTGSMAGTSTAELQKQLSDPELAKATSNCTDTSFNLTIFHFGATDQHLCWDDAARKSNAAMEALSQFFDDRVQDLKWDGQKVQCSGTPLSVGEMGNQPASPENMPAPRKK